MTLDLHHKRLENDIVEYTLENESHTLMRPLSEALRKHPQVTYVSYMEVHPLKKTMKLLLKSENGNENEIVLQIIRELREVLSEYRESIKNSL